MLRLKPGGSDQDRYARRNRAIKAGFERVGRGEIDQHVAMILIDRERRVCLNRLGNRPAHSTVRRDEAEADRLVGGAHARCLAKAFLQG